MNKSSITTAVLFFLIYSSTAFAQLTPSNQIKLPEGKSEWIYRGENGKLIYKTSPAGDKIMDFSHAGYMGGGVSLPNIPTKRIVSPSGGLDDTQKIQAAINDIAKLPLENGFRGAVQLTPGNFICSEAITIPVDGIVLRGSGSGKDGSIIKMTGSRHSAIVIGKGRETREQEIQSSRQEDFTPYKTFITDNYVPSGTISFNVVDAKGFAVGDRIEIQKPVTDAWIKFMEMHDMTRDGKPQTWMRAGSTINTQRTISSIQDNKIILDVPLSDNIDSKYFNPQAASVIKIQNPSLVTQSAVEHLRIQAPPMEMSYQQAPYSAMRINGQDCWARDIQIEETMNSVSIGGRRITLERINITRTVPNLGASKPAEFAPNASQLLLDRCSSIGDNIWHAATGGGFSGPIVLLNCTFGGSGRIEGHQRWTTGILLDNCRIPEGGIDFKNRGSMGSGHGWGTGWSVAWNCLAKNYVIQQPPGAYNWLIGSKGTNIPTPRPFNTAPLLPLGISDSPNTPVAPQSLYLAQLAERLGPQAIRNIGYSVDDITIFNSPLPPKTDYPKPIIDPVYGRDFAAYKYANPSNVREGKLEFGGERAFDGDPKTYWTTNDNITNAHLEIDLENPQLIEVIELQEAKELGQRVQAYKVEGMVDSDWKILGEGTTIDNREIIKFAPVLAWKVRLTILKSHSSPAISTFAIYGEDNTAL